MGFTVFALAAGIILGLLMGGRPRNVTRRPMRGVWALVGAVLLQALPQVLDMSGRVGLACVLASYALLVVFALANIRLVGMPVVLVGLLLNVVVIGLNAGMPVRAAAIRDVDPSVRVERLDFGAKRHLERPDDHLAVLGDVLPVRPVDQIVSFGDLIIAFGVADVAFRLLRPPGPARSGRRRSVPEIVALLPSLVSGEASSRA